MRRDFRFFEGWARANKMVPIAKVSEKDACILIADSKEPFFGENEDGKIGRWYRTSYAIDRGDTTWLASTNEYDAVEFDLISAEEGLKRRVSECLAFAKSKLAELTATGIFDDGKRKSFSIRPH